MVTILVINLWKNMEKQYLDDLTNTSDSPFSFPSDSFPSKSDCRSIHSFRSFYFHDFSHSEFMEFPWTNF